MQSGLRFADGCYVSEDKRILYWEPAKDTLFQVINNILSPLYKIDFGKHKFSKIEKIFIEEEKLYG